MNSFFDAAFNFTIGNEGMVYTNDPRDSGGPTKFGVTQKSYENYIGRLVSTQEIKDLTLEDAKKFYFEKYWKALSCEKLISPAIAICLFDSGVLYGVRTTATMAQKAANKCGASIDPDGFLGDKSIEALIVIRGESFIQAFHELLLLRLEFVISVNPKDEVYRSGWTSRANRILTLNSIENET